ncbi:MAG: hypothetical protein J6J35_01040 [Alphaproteobacteria bacterium]|nr:hypothetical protein [Alphaproteobacteria bacterium]
MPESKTHTRRPNEAIDKAQNKFLALGLVRDAAEFEQDHRKYMELSYKYHRLWLNYCYKNSKRLAGFSAQMRLNGASSIRAAQEAQEMLKKEFEQELLSKAKNRSFEEVWQEEQALVNKDGKCLRPIYNHHALIALSLEEMRQAKKQKKHKPEPNKKTFGFWGLKKIKTFFRKFKKKIDKEKDDTEKAKKEAIRRILANIYRYHQQQIRKKSEQLCELKKRTLERGEKTFRYALMTLPFAGLSYSGFQLAANTKDVLKIPKYVTLTPTKPLLADESKTVALNTPKPAPRLVKIKPQAKTKKQPSQIKKDTEVTKLEIDSMALLQQKIKFSIPDFSADELLAKEIKKIDLSASEFKAYENKILQEKDRDLAEFCEIYRQCAHDNYIKLECGNKRKAFREANIALKHYGFSKISQGLHCSGMSMASLCQAADIFIAKHPQSPVSLAIKDILKNCNNVHSCVALKNDLSLQTGMVRYSPNIEADIKQYMQDKKNAIVFVWTKRTKRQFHHQTFFTAPEGSNQAYIYCAYNNQHWGGEQTFSRYMRSRRRYGDSAYFTDIGESINSLALTYAKKEIARYKENKPNDNDNLWASNIGFSQAAEFIKKSIFTR